MHQLFTIGKAVGPTGVVSEKIKAYGGRGIRSMTDLINNIVKVFQVIVERVYPATCVQEEILYTCVRFIQSYYVSGAVDEGV